MTNEIFEDIKEFARSDIRKGFNRFDVLQHYVNEYYIYLDEYKKTLKRKTKRGSEYKIMETFDKKELAKICKDKILNEEEAEKFRGLFDKYCVKDYKSEISDADIDYARNLPMSELLEGMTDIKIRNKMSNCPFCDGNSDKKFACKDNLFQCFKCGAKGDSIGFYMKLTGQNFIQTIKEMKKW